MKIAMVGGGSRCLYLMDLFESHIFEEVVPEIVAVADIREDAPGLVRAREKGLFVTNDYNDFFNRDGINLIVELTSNLDIYNDILSKKSKHVRAIAHTTALLFWEISRVSKKEAETSQKLQATEALYFAMSNEMIQEDFLVIGRDYRILDANVALLRRLGLKREEVVGRFCYEITHHQDHPCTGDDHPCPLVQVVSSCRYAQTTHIHLDKDNNERYYSISCYPLREHDEVVGVIEASRDITRDILMQKSMMRQEKMVSIGRLSAGVAHEINNPLTTILTSAMLLQEDIDPDDPMHEELQTIANEALRCRKIVKSLLDFARQTHPAKELSDINDVVRESYVLTRKQAAFNDVAVNIHLAENLPRINIDKDQIEQTLINLTLNAIEATPSGGQVMLSTRFIEGSGLIEIEVSDTGVGISPENIDKIFDPFFTTRETGTGLGLAITHGIIEQHGGTIHVESEIGKGAHFFIRFPVKKGAAHAG